MPKYKKIMTNLNIKQSELANHLKKINKKQDKSMLSKYVNFDCIPCPNTLKEITTYIGCSTLDLYDPEELSLLYDKNGNMLVATGLSNKFRVVDNDKTTYKLTVEVPREKAAMLFATLKLKPTKFINDYIDEYLDDLKESKKDSDISAI